jgi:hypothetical protein
VRAWTPFFWSSGWKSGGLKNGTLGGRQPEAGMPGKAVKLHPGRRLGVDWGVVKEV